MVTAMTSGIAVPVDVPLPATGYRRAVEVLGAVVRRGLRFRLRCLILGHEDAFARQPRRLMLRCAACGRETVGWAIGPSAPVEATARPAPSARRATSHDTAVRVGPWTLRRWAGRAESRDRQRQRLVAAASRASEARPLDAGPRRPEGLGAVDRRPGTGIADEATAAVRAIAERLA